MIFRNLSAEEQEKFRQWARDNFKPGETPNSVWHPIVRDEWRLLAEKHERAEKQVPIANPDECEFFEDNSFVCEGPLWLLHFGAYGETALYVWADSCESAFKVATEWLDDNAPGHLVSFDESDYRAAAAELGLEWNPEEPDDRIIEAAEVDHTLIGHTTLEHGTHVASWEWTLNEVAEDSDEWREVVTRSRELEAAEAS